MPVAGFHDGGEGVHVGGGSVAARMAQVREIRRKASSSGSKDQIVTYNLTISEMLWLQRTTKTKQSISGELKLSSGSKDYGIYAAEKLLWLQIKTKLW